MSEIASTLLAGAIAGVTSKASTYPVDLVKARLQIQGSLPSTASPAYRHTAQALLRIIHEEGLFRGLFRGFPFVAVSVAPANMAYFGGYEFGKSIAPEGALREPIIGLVAQLISGIVYTPIDVVKERMQVEGMMAQQRATSPASSTASPSTPSSSARTSALQHVRNMIRAGGVPQLFKGYWLTNSVWLPWNILYVSFYEESRRQWTHSLGLKTVEDLPGYATAASAFVSGGLAATVTAPLDVIKTRLQVQSSSQPDLTARRVLSDLLEKEGARALLKGAGARALSIAPGCAISWLVYGRAKEWISSKM